MCNIMDELSISKFPKNILSTHNSEYIREVITKRWKIALDEGIINFDPNDKTQYKECIIGRYLKRIIPDRIRTYDNKEVLSDHTTPVKIPFINAHGIFNYNKIHINQELCRIYFKNNIYRIIASNSPLTYSHHTLIVPFIDQSHFLKINDLKFSFEILNTFPDYSIMFSSMGAGAGVNHMHMHMIAGREFYPVSHATKKVFYENSAITAMTLLDWPSDVYILCGESNIILDAGIRFINYLQNTNTPHNMLAFTNELWINPRSRKASIVIPDKRLGTWETILGICNACSLNEYNISENEFHKCLKGIRINKTEKIILDHKIKEIMDEIQ